MTLWYESYPTLPVPFLLSLSLSLFLSLIMCPLSASPSLSYYLSSSLCVFFSVCLLLLSCSLLSRTLWLTPSSFMSSITLTFPCSLSWPFPSLLCFVHYLPPFCLWQSVLVISLSDFNYILSSFLSVSLHNSNVSFFSLDHCIFVEFK